MLNLNLIYRPWVSALFLALAWAWSPASALGQLDAAEVDDATVPVPGSEGSEDALESAGDSVVPETPPEDNLVVESAEYLSSARPAEESGAESEPTAEPPSFERRPRLLFVADAREPLLHMLELQLPDWQVRHIAGTPSYLRIWRARAQLMPDDVVVWIERSGDVERVALLDGAGNTPCSSMLPAADVQERPRVFALIVEGLIREQRAESQDDDSTATEACPESSRLIDLRIYEPRVTRPRRTRRRRFWRSPVARDGWMFRLGWTQGFTPRRRNWAPGSSTQSVHVSGGIRVAAGRWLHKNIRLSLVGELARANREPEGVLGLQAMLVTGTRLRMGIGFELAGLLVSETDTATGNRFGWVGHRIGLPLEIGFEVNRKGGFFLNLGPTWTKAPYAEHHLGYQLSVEWEFN